MEYYKKKYEEALVKLQELFQKGEKNNSLVINNYRKLFEEIFPELRDSEDEMIRKELIGMVEEDWPGRSDVLAWLEKQGEKPVEWSDEDEDAIAEGIIALEGMYDPDEPERCYAGYTLPFNKAAERLKSLRAQNRWKPSDLQIEALESVAENCAYSEYQDCLRDLAKQLKKLKA